MWHADDYADDCRDRIWNMSSFTLWDLQHEAERRGDLQRASAINRERCWRRDAILAWIFGWHSD